MLLKLTYCKGMWSMVGGLESRGAWTEVEAAERGAEGKWLLCWLRRGLTSNPCRPKGDPWYLLPSPRCQAAAPDMSRHAFPSQIHSKSDSNCRGRRALGLGVGSAVGEAPGGYGHSP